MRSSLVRRGSAAALLAAASLLSACASGLGPNDYSRGQVGAVGRVEPGVVMSAQPIRIEGTKSGIGTATGVAIGGAAGSQLGGGSFENVLGGVAGAVAGGLAGAAIEEGVTRQPGVSYYIRLERTGEVITIQQAGAQMLPPGAPVWVQYGPRARVVPR